MKKTGIIKLVLCILAISAMLVSFAVMASAADGDITGGVIYKLNSSSLAKITAKPLVDANGDPIMISDGEGGTKQATANFSLLAWNYSIMYVYGHPYTGNGSTYYTVATKTGITNSDGNTVTGYCRYTAADLENLYAHSSTTDLTAATRIDTGLRYDFDAATGTLTIYESESVTSDVTALWGFPLGYMDYIESLADLTEEDENYADKGNYYDSSIKYFPRSNTKTIIIKGEHITQIPEKCLNNFSSTTKIIIPKTLTKIGNEGCARLYSLRTLCVEGSGMEIDNVIDLRNITSQVDNSFTAVCASGNHYVLLGETTCTQPNNSWGNNSGTGTFYVFVPDGYNETCTWIGKMTTSRVIKFNMILCRYPSSRAVSEVGYQVRTSSYNGLRCQFAYNESAASSASYTTTPLTWTTGTGWTAGSTSQSGFTLKEWGTIAGIEAKVNEYGLNLSKNGDGVYETANEKIKKVSNTDLEGKVTGGKFFVTIVNYTTQAQMTAPFCMSGYEIWTDETTGLDFIFFTANDKGHTNVSIYDAVIGMYQYGLINKSMESDNVFWGILDNCRVDLNTTKNAENISAYENDSKSTYSYSFAEDGSVIDNSGAGAKVSVFKSKDFSTGEDKYVGIVSSNGSVTTFRGGSFNYQIPGSTSWTGGNLLSPNYLGVTIDTLVIDSDITQTGGRGALGMYRDCARVVIYPDNIKLTNQVFNGNKFIETFIPFSRCTSIEDWDSVVGVLDTSKADLSSSELSWSFNQLQKISTVLLPAGSMSKSGTLTSACFKESLGKITSIYCPDYYEENGLTPEAGTADFRGTNTLFDYTKEVSLSTNAVFYNSKGITKAISYSYDENENKYEVVSCRDTTASSYAQHYTWALVSSTPVS